MVFQCHILSHQIYIENKATNRFHQILYDNISLVGKKWKKSQVQAASPTLVGEGVPKCRPLREQSTWFGFLPFPFESWEMGLGVQTGSFGFFPSVFGVRLLRITTRKKLRSEHQLCWSWSLQPKGVWSSQTRRCLANPRTAWYIKGFSRALTTSGWWKTKNASLPPPPPITTSKGPHPLLNFAEGVEKIVFAITSQELLRRRRGNFDQSVVPQGLWSKKRCWWSPVVFHLQKEKNTEEGYEPLLNLDHVAENKCLW